MSDNPKKLRHLINYKVEGKPACNICNPILPCAEGSICEECFKWLAEEEPKT